MTRKFFFRVFFLEYWISLVHSQVYFYFTKRSRNFLDNITQKYHHYSLIHFAKKPFFCSYVICNQILLMIKFVDYQIARKKYIQFKHGIHSNTKFLWKRRCLKSNLILNANIPCINCYSVWKQTKSEAPVSIPTIFFFWRQ